MTRRPRRAWFVLILLVAGTGGAAPAAAEQTGERADALFGDWLAETNAVGVAAAVARDGKIVWSGGFGYADLEQTVPVRPEATRFRVGSVAKPFTALALLRLVEAGRLDLDAPIQRYLPRFPEKRGVVTTRLLAGHIAGIRHYRGDEFLGSEHYETVSEGLAIFREDSLVCEPGAEFRYSSYGWNLVSAVMEASAGRDFLGLMTEHVFEPLGMTGTVADHVDSIVVHRGRYYELHDGRPLNAVYVDNSCKWASGGFLSTAEDLVRFGSAHLDTAVVDLAARRLLWTSQRTLAGEETGYGIGWFSGVDEQGRPHVGHGGGSVGGKTWFRIYPASGVVLAFICNTSGAPFGSLPERFVALFLDSQQTGGTPGPIAR